MGMRRELFGTDGVRGVANRELTCELALALGRASTVWVSSLARTSRHPRVLVGRDGRRSGAMLEAAFSAGVSSVGGEPVSLGIIPTPAVAMLLEMEHADLGVVVSASHNPFYDNGLKFFGPAGIKLGDEQESAIEALLHTELTTHVDGENVGWFSARSDARVVYAGEILRRLEPLLSNAIGELRIVVDCANGAAWPAAGVAFQRAGIHADFIGTAADGTNINRGCGSTDLALLSRTVRESDYDLGIAFDGDADRLIAVDENGAEVDGDAILGLLALDLQKLDLLADNRIVCTQMSNLGLHRTLNEHGIAVTTCDVGDRYVIAEMLRTGAVLGGEQSGHMIYTGVQRTGDGIATALMLLGALQRCGVTLSEAASRIQRLPQRLRSVPVANKAGLTASTTVRDAVAAHEAELGANGRIVLRPSGTEPLVRVMVEATDAARCEQIVDELCTLVDRELGPAPVA